VRSAVRGGWAARARNADAWFLLTWVGFIFLFFSKSHSKLVPYILPVFPALAVLIGAWLAQVRAAGDPGKLRSGLRVFSFVSGLLAVAFVLVVLRPSLVRGFEASKALQLQPIAFTLAAILILGGIVAPWLARIRGIGAALTALAVTMAGFLGVLQLAAPVLNKPSTKELALYVKARVQPGDRVVHYHAFFHEFTFYAERVVDVAAYKDELEFEEDAPARASGRFYDDAEFLRRWNSPVRLWVVAKRRDVKALFADPTFQYHLLGSTEDHYLFSNQP
jgi:4-amino-4-deoxy-L-arabinose transferase-like glycosyltransferase